MVTSVYNSEGYYDHYNVDGAQLKQYEGILVYYRRKGATVAGEDVDNNPTKYRYEFAFTPNFGFLASPEPLPKNCELKLSFDRSNWKTAITGFDPITNVATGLAIEDCHAITEYVSSPQIRDYFEQINYHPIGYDYEDCDVIIKSIMQDETEIRYHNLRGGNPPSHIFAGLIAQSDLSGNATSSSTSFKQYNVEEFNIEYNGTSVNGYPIQIKADSTVYPMYKFHDVTGRLHNLSCGSGFDLDTFRTNFLWAHKFEEDLENGWIGITMKLTKAFTEPMNLVVWVISQASLTIDKYHQIEKIN